MDAQTDTKKEKNNFFVGKSDIFCIFCHIFSVSGEIVFDDPEIGVEMHQMLERIETKKKANSQRLMDLIERMQRLDDICKKVGKKRLKMTENR